MTTPNPGSPEALAQGCLCPVLDNGHGRGAWSRPGDFWINEECPLHQSDPNSIGRKKVQETLDRIKGT